MGDVEISQIQFWEMLMPAWDAPYHFDIPQYVVVYGREFFIQPCVWVSDINYEYLCLGMELQYALYRDVGEDVLSRMDCAKSHCLTKNGVS